MVGKIAGRSNAPQKRILSIDDGNQNELLNAPTISKDFLSEIRGKYSWSNFDEYDNRVYAFMDKLLYPAIRQANIQDFELLWDSFSRTQKIFYTLITFDGQVKNGGVYQFLFNYPELGFAALESFEEIDETKLREDYEKTISEFLGKTSTIGELKQAFNDQSLDWEKRWASFSSGYNELKTTKTIEDYFYTTDFCKSHFQLISKFLESNIEQMAQIGE